LGFAPASIIQVARDVLRQRQFAKPMPEVPTPPRLSAYSLNEREHSVLKVLVKRNVILPIAPPEPQVPSPFHRQFLVLVPAGRRCAIHCQAALSKSSRLLCSVGLSTFVTTRASAYRFLPGITGPNFIARYPARAQEELYCDGGCRDFQIINFPHEHLPDRTSILFHMHSFLPCQFQLAVVTVGVRSQVFIFSKRC